MGHVVHTGLHMKLISLLRVRAELRKVIGVVRLVAVSNLVTQLTAAGFSVLHTYCSPQLLPSLTGCLSVSVVQKLSVFTGPLLHLAQVRQLCHGLTWFQVSHTHTQIITPILYLLSRRAYKCHHNHNCSHQYLMNVDSVKAASLLCCLYLVPF